MVELSLPGSEQHCVAAEEGPHWEPTLITSRQGTKCCPDGLQYLEHEIVLLCYYFLYEMKNVLGSEELNWVM